MTYRLHSILVVFLKWVMVKIMDDEDITNSVTLWEKLCGPAFWKGAVFVPSSLGLVASTTPVEFHTLVKAAYSTILQWNSLLNWIGALASKYIPLIPDIDADIINSLIVAFMVVPLALRVATAGVSGGMSPLTPKPKNQLVKVSPPKKERVIRNLYSNLINIRPKGDPTKLFINPTFVKFIESFGFVLLAVISVIAGLYYASSMQSDYGSFLRTGLFCCAIGMIIFKSIYSTAYRKTMAISVGILTALQLLYWGNFTPWVEWVEKVVA